MTTHSYAKYDASKSLNLFSYYALVFSSFTGLSTLLGLTELVKMNEYHDTSDQTTLNHHCVWPLENRKKLSPSALLVLQSRRDPSIRINNSIFEYLECHVIQLHQGINNDENREATKEKNKSIHHDQPTFSIKRNFEYYFRLVGLSVIMVHFACTYKGQTSLHLVEVYHIQNVIIRYVFKILFGTLGTLVNSVFGKTGMDRRVKSC